MGHPMQPVLDTRRAGILLHITSLPATGDIDEDGFVDRVLGDFGSAYPFIDFLVLAGISVWQVLPLGPTHKDLSPYLCTSSLAGNSQLIDLQRLRRLGWLSDKLVARCFKRISDFRIACLKDAFEGFKSSGNKQSHSDYQRFITEHDSWLTDFSLFTALSRTADGTPWMSWQHTLRDREPEALRSLLKNMATPIEQVKFEQFVFYSQWLEIKSYANSRGVLIFGDMPLFVAHDSAEVWANRQYFKVDQQGKAAVVAGVPPDYFSENGQKWGNPVYNWPLLQADGFQWWIKRLRAQLELYDLLRIDHFRGLEACWEIPAEAESAVEGHWKKTPGFELLQTLQQTFGHLPLVAEDLGFITAEVHHLREQFNLPGMEVMQFAFDGSPDNPYLLQNHSTNAVAYPGTHDNDTSLAWYQNLPEGLRKNVDKEINRSELAMPWSLIDYTMASPSLLVVLSMQDILDLGKGFRFNTPGTIEGNWQWQFSWPQVPDDLPARLHNFVEKHQRLGDSHSASV